MNVLVIAPHYDDETIGCGGTIALHTKGGDTLHVLFVTAGATNIQGVTDPAAIQLVRKSEAEAACAILGVTQLHHLSLPDRAWQPPHAVPLFVRVIRQVRPHIVYLPHRQDGDVEHELVHQTGREAIWQAASPVLLDYGELAPPVQQVFGYEIWRPLPRAQLIRDITGVVELKRRALAAYPTQLAVRRWDLGSLGLNQYRATTTGVGTYAEAFEVILLR